VLWVYDFHESRIYPPRETAVAFDTGPESFNRRPIDLVDFYNGVRITHRHGADNDRLPSDLERVGIHLVRRLERQGPRIEIRHAHVDRHYIVREDACVDESSRAIHGDDSSRGAATAVE
jgi:hypothetical protein